MTTLPDRLRAKIDGQRDEWLRLVHEHVPTSTGCCLRCCDSFRHRETGLSNALWPCNEIRDLADCLGLSIDEETTDGTT